MNKHNNILLTTLLALTLSLLGASAAHAQFADCSTGLLQMPTAEMQEDGTFMITNNFLNKHSLPTSGWDYNTFQYGFYVSFWGRIELGYVCTLNNDRWDPTPTKRSSGIIMINQDRHFTGRLCLLREGEFGLDWMPALVVGVSDPVTGSGGGEYIGSKVDGSSNGNGFFNRNFAVFTKHFSTLWGQIGVSAGYQFNRRSDYLINAPCIGLNWRPVWLQDRGMLDRFDVVAEYDSRSVNLGFIASIWENRFEAMLDLQSLRWISFGIRYKVQIRKN